MKVPGGILMKVYSMWHTDGAVPDKVWCQRARVYKQDLDPDPVFKQFMLETHGLGVNIRNNQLTLTILYDHDKIQR